MGLNNNYFTFKKNCDKGNSVLLVPHLFYDHLFHMHPSIDFTASSSIYYFMLSEAVLGFRLNLDILLHLGIYMEDREYA